MNQTILQILRYLFLIGLPTIFIGVAVIALLKVFILPAFATSRTKQETKQPACILKKREEVLSSNGIVSLYLITFKLDNDSIELRVPKDVFFQLESGDRGQLINVGDRFVNFFVTEKSVEKSTPQVILAGDSMRSSLNIIEQKQKE